MGRNDKSINRYFAALGQTPADSDILYLHVKNELSKMTGLDVEYKREPEGLYIPKPYDHFLDVHISTSKSFFWNFYKLKLENVSRTYSRWSILLIGGRVRTYVNDDNSEYQKPVLLRIYNIPSEEFEKRSNGYWTEGISGGFKVNDEGDDVSGIPSFTSIRDLVKNIFTKLGPPP